MHSERQVNSVARKKVVFVIVEGPSDDTALGVILNRLYDQNKVHIEIMHGDITADLSIDPSDIASALGDIVKHYAATMHFSQVDFQKVIHLVDMDGAFIPETAIVDNADAEKPLYSLTDIQTSKPEKLALRNKHKQSKLDRISGLKRRGNLSHFRRTICLAIWIMFYTESRTVPMRRKKMMRMHLPNSTKMTLTAS